MDKEKEKLQNTSRCFRTYYISKYSSTRQNRNTEYRRPAPTQNTHSGITKEPEIKKELKDVLANVKAYLSTEENR